MASHRTDMEPQGARNHRRAGSAGGSPERRPPQADATAGRSAGALLMAGALLLLVGNAMHPTDPEPTAISRLPLALDGLWLPIHLTLAAGFGMVLAGLLRFLRSFSSTGSSAARLGSLAALLGGTLLVVVFAALDGAAIRWLALSWQEAGAAEREVLHATAAALESVDTGFAALGTLLFLGLSLVGTGTAALRERRAAFWSGAAAVAIGAAGTATGLLLLVQGATPATINLLLRPVGLASTVFFAALGFTLWRGRASEPA